MKNDEFYRNNYEKNFFLFFNNNRPRGARTPYGERARDALQQCPRIEKRENRKACNNENVCPETDCQRSPFLRERQRSEKPNRKV